MRYDGNILDNNNGKRISREEVWGFLSHCKSQHMYTPTLIKIRFYFAYQKWPVKILRYLTEILEGCSDVKINRQYRHWHIRHHIQFSPSILVFFRGIRTFSILEKHDHAPFLILRKDSRSIVVVSRDNFRKQFLYSAL